MKTGHIDFDNESLKQRCIRAWNALPFDGARISKGVIEKQATKYDPFYNPHTWEEFKPVLNIIKSFTDTEIKYSFMHVINRGALQNAHIHPDATHSVFVYYPNQVEEHPPIEFFLDGVWTPYKCYTGDWIYFPKKTLHRVDGRNKTWGEDRIVISVTI